LVIGVPRLREKKWHPVSISRPAERLQLSRSCFFNLEAMMKYLLLIYAGEKSINESDRQHCYEESTQLAHDLHAKGQYVSAAPLHPVTTATSVRIRDGKRLVTDGPFAETREHLGGFFMIDARDLDEAIGIAARIPGARWGTVEVRPVIEMQGMPKV
jgi:hypothetical protein